MGERKERKIIPNGQTTTKQPDQLHQL